MSESHFFTGYLSNNCQRYSCAMTKIDNGLKLQIALQFLVSIFLTYCFLSYYAEPRKLST